VKLRAPADDSAREGKSIRATAVIARQRSKSISRRAKKKRMELLRLRSQRRRIPHYDFATFAAAYARALALTPILARSWTSLRSEANDSIAPRVKEEWHIASLRSQK